MTVLQVGYSKIACEARRVFQKIACEEEDWHCSTTLVRALPQPAQARMTG